MSKPVPQFKSVSDALQAYYDGKITLDELLDFSKQEANDVVAAYDHISEDMSEKKHGDAQRVGIIAQIIG